MADDRTSSMIEVAAIQRPAASYDVAILGGGLAGLTLALQLAQGRPQTSVVVLKKREGPAPQAAFKVGESTVAIGGDYFANKVGLKDHLVEHQLRKAGLRFFCPAGDNSDITRRVESGPPLYPPHDTFQIDRGLFENELASRARAAGVDVLAGRARAGGRARRGHARGRLRPVRPALHAEARWVVDAAGRSAIMKRKLGLAKDVGHTINSAWLRLGGGMDFEQWGAAGRGLDGAHVRARNPPVQHQPPHRRGLLGVADPARHRSDQHRRLRRPALSPVRGDRRARRLPRLARPPRAAARRRHPAAHRRHPGLPARAGLRLRRRAHDLHRPLGARRRGRRIRRSVPLARLRHDRAVQHDRRRRDRARPRRAGHTRARRLLRRALPSEPSRTCCRAPKTSIRCSPTPGSPPPSSAGTPT